MASKGKVYLVGAGPGDPELLTLKGRRVLGLAQAVVYDFLANPELLAYAPAEAERIYVGKRGGGQYIKQPEINQLLVDLGLAGKVVVRLKGGDSFVFGRGGEEASALAAAGIPIEVVPGVTSAIAGPAYAGIPVTDRRHATEVAFVTGHEDPTKPESTINWGALAAMGSVVFLMGVRNLPRICEQLIAHGKPADTPAACVRWATTTRQRTVSGTLTDLPDKVKAAGIKPPAITIVGGVASLRDELNWFETLPLFGKRVLVTRTRGQASKLSRALYELGAQPVEVPTIAVQEPDDPSILRRAVEGLGEYDFVVLTSANGVEALFARMAEAGQDARALAGATVCAIGPATAQALKERGITPDVTARTFVAEGLLEALKGRELKGARVLIPRAQEAREVLPDTLRQWGATVEVAPAYRTVAPPESAELLRQAMADGIDAITFTASSTVTNLMALAGEAERQALLSQNAAGGLTVASIGPITSDTAREAGFSVQVEPERYTIPDLVQALVKHYQSA